MSSVSNVEWWKDQMTLREKKAVVKLRNRDGSFRTSVHIPTEYWPLNGPYEVFHSENTARVDIAEIYNIFDSVNYKIGRCYTNTKNLYGKLKEAGFDVKTYAGWSFILEDIPIHHCWVVLDNGESRSVLDLADDDPMMVCWLSEHSPKWPNTNREDHVNWLETALKMPNTARCYPVGQVSPRFCYVGCECDPDEAVSYYNQLIFKYPDHMCERNCGPDHVNRTQAMLMERGLMERF